MMGACGWLCCSIELGWASPGGSGDCACRQAAPLSRFVPRAGVVQLPDCVCLPTHPPTGGAGFVCLSGMVFPCPGGRCRSLSPPGRGECDTMDNAVPYGTVGVWHTQSELHDLSYFGAVCSYPLGKHEWTRGRKVDGFVLRCPLASQESCIHHNERVGKRVSRSHKQ